MSNLCIIPARGGSKRIPRKNIKDFLGKPIIAYSIEAALKSNLFDEVMVSTDDIEIAEIAQKFGAKVPFMRSQKNSDDFATTFDVLNEVIEKYKKEGILFEYACCIYPTAPLVTVNKILIAKEMLMNKKFDTVFPILQYSFPIQRALKKEDDKITMINPENLNKRSQDLENSYHDAGQFYFLNIEQVLSKGKILTNNTGGVLITDIEGQDIDNYDDWKLAELKYKIINNVSR
ncbi:MAG: pseudaminic acid cytidylyltransferase [Putridiphycobacter sp.]